jgi:two-component system nitrate/nitrite response regulator NarL
VDKVKIFIVDDHQLLIDGIKLMLSGIDDFEVCGESNSAILALSKINPSMVDVVLTDISMPDMTGMEFAIKLKEKHPSIKILILSMFENAPLLKKLISIGIHGYILKHKGKEELIYAIRSILKGTRYFTEELKIHIRENNNTGTITLTKREIEVVVCISKGFSSPQIAKALFISENTVETHRRNIFRKTNSHSAIELINYAKEQHII